jgi:hypothetical protein
MPYHAPQCFCASSTPSRRWTHTRVGRATGPAACVAVADYAGAATGEAVAGSTGAATGIAVAGSTGSCHLHDRERSCRYCHPKVAVRMCD